MQGTPVSRVGQCTGQRYQITTMQSPTDCHSCLYRRIADFFLTCSTSDSDLKCPGDTLFALGCGRLFEGDAKTMWNSLSKMLPLPADTQVYCAHEYTQSNARFAVSVDPNNTALQERKGRIDGARSRVGPYFQTHPHQRVTGDSSCPSWLAWLCLKNASQVRFQSSTPNGCAAVVSVLTRSRFMTSSQNVALLFPSRPSCVTSQEMQLSE